MKGIERSLHKYITGAGPKVSIQEVSIYAVEHGDDLVDILFKCLNSVLNDYIGECSLQKLHEAFMYLDVIIASAEELDRVHLTRRLYKLSNKIENIRYERRNVFLNPEKVNSELDELQEKIEKAHESNNKQDNKQFDFMYYLISEPQNIAYIEYTFKKLPQIVNIKDKDGKSLYHTVITRFLETLSEEDEEQTLYLINLISLIQHQRAFRLEEHEKRKILEELYKHIEWMSCNKKLAKKNKDKINYINIIKEMIKQENEKGVDIESIATKYNVPVFFDEEITGAVALIQEPTKENYPDRMVEKEYIVTIDGPDAIEIDDGLSCKRLPDGNYMIGIHIASVLGYFPYYSEIVEEAFRRNHTIYLKEQYQDKDNDYSRVVPIFPYEFSANKGSLLEGQPRLARSYFYEITPQGEVVNQSFSKSIVTNRKKLSYHEANDILKHGTEDKELEETLINLHEVTAILERKSKANSSPVYETMKNSTSNHADLKVRKKGSENIVYQAMLLNGSRVAEHLVKHKYPCLLRVHSLDQDEDARTQEMIDYLLKDEEGSKLEKIAHLIDSIYPKGTYDTEGRHDGLDLDYYCHCTSSLRRAQDVLIEHILEVCYDNEATAEDIAELWEEVEKRKIQINSRTKPIDWFAQEYNRTHIKRRRSH